METHTFDFQFRRTLCTISKRLMKTQEKKITKQIENSHFCCEYFRESTQNCHMHSILLFDSRNVRHWFGAIDCRNRWCIFISFKIQIISPALLVTRLRSGAYNDVIHQRLRNRKKKLHFQHQESINANRNELIHIR